MRIFFLCGALFLFASCATLDIYSDYDRSVNFNSYKTFAWIPNPDQPYQNSKFNNRIIESNIKNYASQEMQIMGYKVDVDSPDLMIQYSLMIEKKTTDVQTPVYSNDIPPPYFNHPYNYNLRRS